jgi:predicted amino acid racemase
VTTIVSSRTPAAARSTPTELLGRYRVELLELVTIAEGAAPTEPAVLRTGVDRLVENLNRDLLELYRAAETGVLKARDSAILVPAFEKLRNVLRHRDVRLCSMRDTLHKAVTGMPAMSQERRESV